MDECNPLPSGWKSKPAPTPHAPTTPRTTTKAHPESQGLTLVHFSAQLELLMTQNTAPKHPLITPKHTHTPPKQPLHATPMP